MKPSVLTEADSSGSRQATAWRWAMPCAAFGLLLAVGAGVALAYQVQRDYRGTLSAGVLERWARGGVGPLTEAALLVGLWILWRIARKAALYGAFLGVEAGLPGRRPERRTFRFALATQLSIALLYAVGATILLLAGPIQGMPAPLINLAQAEVESLLGPLAPLAIALIALFVYDFTGYWLHRAQHPFAFLWRFHSVHHSVENMDSLNSYAHPVDMLAQNAVIALVGLGIGFTFETMLWFLAFQTIHDRLLHTSAPINFGVLGGVLVDNRAHFLHHTRVESRSGRNFGAVLTLFDRMFGTWERPEAGTLTVTGIEGRGPPATLGNFFLARLDGRGPAETAARNVSPATPACALHSHPSA